MTETRRRWFNSGVELWATAHVPSVVGAATPLKLQNSDPLDIALGGKTDTNRFDKTECLKRAGEAVATEFLNNRATSSTGEDKSGGRTAISERYIADAGRCSARILMS